jgi:hypothetical protein
MTESSKTNQSSQKLSITTLLLIACAVALFNMLVVSILTNTMHLKGDVTKLLLDITLIVPFVLALGKAFEIQLRK